MFQENSGTSSSNQRTITRLSNIETRLGSLNLAEDRISALESVVRDGNFANASRGEATPAGGRRVSILFKNLNIFFGVWFFSYLFSLVDRKERAWKIIVFLVLMWFYQSIKLIYMSIDRSFNIAGSLTIRYLQC